MNGWKGSALFPILWFLRLRPCHVRVRAVFSAQITASDRSAGRPYATNDYATTSPKASPQASVRNTTIAPSMGTQTMSSLVKQNSNVLTKQPKESEDTVCASESSPRTTSPPSVTDSDETATNNDETAIDSSKDSVFSAKKAKQPYVDYAKELPPANWQAPTNVACMNFAEKLHHILVSIEYGRNAACYPGFSLTKPFCFLN